MITNAQVEIIQTQHQIWDAIIKLDFETLAAIYPVSHQFRHVGGKKQSREDYFDFIRSGTFRYYDYRPVKETVRLVDPDHAILHAVAKSDASIYGFRKVWKMDFELPFERVKGKWRPANDN